ncbi:MAG: circularly permuted type 2 ATP-grasp protein [Clostridiales bacterium]|nr:circularly permuted type 2 ATP-grasp protein [Clostridiales bacterium]
MDELIKHAGQINQQLSRYGVKFGIYKNGRFNERLFPFDAISRVVSAEEWRRLEKGLIQRVDALNAFLEDIYGSKKSIIKDNVVPEEFVYLASGYLPECEGYPPPKGIYSHISGIDLVQDKNGDWFVLEDNLRIPSGASYPLIAREMCRKCSPETFRKKKIVDNRNYGALLREVMGFVNTGGANVILTPGRYNAAYFEHSLLAEMSQAILAEVGDLVVEENILYYRSYDGKQRVGSVYRRISDEFIDPLYFKRESLIGVPNIMSVYRSGNVAMVNAPGNGVADDKGIYYFVPKMIKYYLNEDPILLNAPTYLPFYEGDRKFVLENIENLVIKDVAEAGGYGVVFGNSLPKEKLAELKEKILENPRRFIAQEVIDFKGLPLMLDGKRVERKADFRAYVLTAGQTKVWPSGLTRFSTDPASFIVNSSQGGGFKDTWVLC